MRHAHAVAILLLALLVCTAAGLATGASAQTELRPRARPRPAEAQVAAPKPSPEPSFAPAARLTLQGLPRRFDGAPACRARCTDARLACEAVDDACAPPWTACLLRCNAA